MTKNKHGAFIDFSKIEMPIKTLKGKESYEEGITLNYGKHEKKWGYAIEYTYSNGWSSSTLNEKDFNHSTKNKMLFAAKKEIIELCNKYFDGNLMFKIGHLDYLLDKVLDKFTIECTFIDSESCFTLVTTKSTEEVFKYTEELFSKPITSFSFLGENNIILNPIFKKEIRFIQGELF